eukprot:scaffold406684_cov15-Prasinocladus_malaysianus.AAC.1
MQFQIHKGGAVYPVLGAPVCETHPTCQSQPAPGTSNARECSTALTLASKVSFNCSQSHCSSLEFAFVRTSEVLRKVHFKRAIGGSSQISSISGSGLQQESPG